LKLKNKKDKELERKKERERERKRETLKNGIDLCMHEIRDNIYINDTNDDAWYSKSDTS